MDTITTIIITAFINIAISSFLFYRYQKSIDLSFAKKLKEFEHKLQFSQFQQQTIFSKIYPKTLDVLENYHQKLLNCTSLVSNHIITSIGASLQSKPLDKAKKLELENEVREAKDDLDSYLEQSRLHIPDDILETVEQIHNKVLTFMSISRTLIGNPKKILPQLVRMFDITEETVDFSKPENINVFVAGKLCSELVDLCKQVEKIYKSAIQVKSPEAQ